MCFILCNLMGSVPDRYTKGQTGIQSSPAWLSTVFYCFEETTNKYQGSKNSSLLRYWVNCQRSVRAYYQSQIKMYLVLSNSAPVVIERDSAYTKADTPHYRLH